jgi:hypothetical protein
MMMTTVATMFLSIDVTIGERFALLVAPEKLRIHNSLRELDPSSRMASNERRKPDRLRL